MKASRFDPTYNLSQMLDKSKFVTFYVDDSACEIAGKKHFILAATHFEDEDAVLRAWLKKKTEFGIPPHEEVKWNSNNLSVDQRREFVPLASAGTAIVVIDDRTKQDAALKITEQVWRYCKETDREGFRVRFDHNIVSDWPQLKQHANAFFPPCVGLCDADSAFEHLVQAADFLAGAIKLKVDFGSGARDYDKKIKLSPKLAEGYASEEECEIGWFVFASLRYCLWGHTAATEDKPYEPWKTTLDRGVTCNSSAPTVEVERALAELDRFFMGCIH